MFASLALNKLTWHNIPSLLETGQSQALEEISAAVAAADSQSLHLPHRGFSIK
jgi:hypothetical protein